MLGYVAREQDRREHGDDFEHEDHRVLYQPRRIELDESLTDRRDNDLRVEHRRGGRALAHFRGFHGHISEVRSEHRRHREMLDDRPERERWEECKAADDQDDADGEANEQPAGGREGAA